MIINHNMNALNAHRNMTSNTTAAGKSMEKLSSGLRINRAGDDAAGLAISEKMRGQIRGLDQASRNAQDGISLIQTAEGALNETHSILQRMRELSVQGANDTNVEQDRGAIKAELDQLSAEIDRIANTTQFNKQNLLDGSFGVEIDASTSLKEGADGVTKINASGMKASTTITLTVAGNKVKASDGNGLEQEIDFGAATGSGTLNFDKLGLSIELNGSTLADLNSKTVVTTAQQDKNLQIGANENQKLAFNIGDMSAKGLTLTTSDLLVDTHENSNSTLTKVENAIKTVSNERSKLGAMQNRLEHTINNLGTSSENLTAAESRVRDVDMAKEMMTFSKNNILQQAAQAMLAQANQQPQGVLQLLR
ncbi:flagellin [Clostridium sartagoforme]|uniref:Flagellin n=1 Tax=Clostridium sartagoforme TaxID=84031 RepID=A0A4S2DRG5_9CLOT|nr:flagellin [Clostridium sartagoforme]TGY43784.1 flagellin [Clostridium sartagoforme]